MLAPQVCCFNGCNVWLSLTGNRICALTGADCSSFDQSLVYIRMGLFLRSSTVFIVAPDQRFTFPTLLDNNPANSQCLELVLLFRSSLLCQVGSSESFFFTLSRSTLLTAAQVAHFSW